MPRNGERKYIRADDAIDQRAFDEHHNEVGIDLQDQDHVWSEILSFGEKFLKNIADFSLGESTQPKRGEILVTRNESSQEIRAVAFRAAKHEQPRVTLPHNIVKTVVPREDEKRSIKTARRQRHARAFWTIGHEQKDRGTQLRKLSLGGFQTNIGKQYKLREAALERLERMKNAESARLAQIIPQDDITF